MATVTASVVLVVHNQVALTRACVESLDGTSVPFELCVVDNGSADGTGEYLDRLQRSRPVRYRRNDDNVGLIRALNQGAELATGDLLCFLHNDTEMRDPRWLERLSAAVQPTRRIGLAGLYGVRRLRRDGRYVGRTVVHCLAGQQNLRAPIVEVAAVDGVCLCLARDVLDAVGGFDEGYGFFHGYDRDLSFAVRELGLHCAVVSAPFVHRGGGTRTGPDAPTKPRDDLAQRRDALARFARKWAHRLPCDVRPLDERLRDWLTAPRTV
ncbi:MAG TPA: glycosyltransferase [Methylomirabilota bacterium]